MGQRKVVEIGQGGCRGCVCWVCGCRKCLEGCVVEDRAVVGEWSGENWVFFVFVFGMEIGLEGCGVG